MNNILVVCIGNICRSPMAEGMLKVELPNINIRSAGIGALVGKPADPTAIHLMAERGIDITGHRAQQINLTMVSQANLILVMDREQRRFIEKRYSNACGKIYQLGAKDNVEIPDPYRETIQRFQAAELMIETGVKFWASQIAQLT